MTSPVVIGVGNEWRRDDGVGWAVARAVRTALEGRVEVVLTDGEPARLIDAWAGAGTAVLVDAACSGAPPGTVRVLDGVAAGLVAGPGLPGSHGLGIGTAVRLGAALRRLPGRLVVIGVEGEDFGEGVGLSPAVEGAVAAAAAEACRWAGVPPSPLGSSQVEQ